MHTSQTEHPQIYKVVHLNNYTSKVKDEFFENQLIDTVDIMRQIFLIDGRVYKHYRMLLWFPKYMENMFHTQVFLMHNNDAGPESNNSSQETTVFPKHVNYYLAIMAVSCYQCEYLLCILQE